MPEAVPGPPLTPSVYSILHADSMKSLDTEGLTKDVSYPLRREQEVQE